MTGFDAQHQLEYLKRIAEALETIARRLEDR
jgi:hypothetical protein